MADPDVSLKKCLDESMNQQDRVSLKDYLETKLESLFKAIKDLIDERDRLYDTRFKASEVAVNAALAAQEKAVNAAFLASEKAIVKAEDAQREYNIRSNEFRGQLDDQAKTLMPRPETVGLFKAVEDKFVFVQQNFESKLEAQRVSNEKVFDSVTKEIASLRESRSEGAGKGMGYQNFWGILLAVVGVLLALSRFIPMN